MSGVRKFTTAIALVGISAFTVVPCVTVAHEIAPAQQTAEENGFRFNLQNCERSGESVTCNFMITNIGSGDESLTLKGSTDANTSRVFDFSGNEYLVVANQAGQSQSQGGRAEVNLIRNIPTRASVRFELPTEVSDLAVLAVGYYGRGVNSQAQFRDVAITVP